MSEPMVVHSLPLPPKSLRELRARAHVLKPVVRISPNGISEGVLREVDRALSAHELIKIHAAVDDRLVREQLLDSICRQLGAQAVQIIGKMLVAFRQRAEPEAKTIRPPAAPPKPQQKARRANRPTKPARTMTPRSRAKMRPKSNRTR